MNLAVTNLAAAGLCDEPRSGLKYTLDVEARQVAFYGGKVKHESQFNICVLTVRFHLPRLGKTYRLIKCIPHVQIEVHKILEEAVRTSLLSRHHIHIQSSAYQ